MLSRLASIGFVALVACLVALLPLPAVVGA